MGLLEVHSPGLAEAFNRQLRNPGPAPEPESFSAWSFMKSGVKGPVSGGLETAGSVADVAGLMQRGEEDFEKRRRDKAGIPQTDFAGMAFAARRKADEFAPNPQTASTADQVIHGLTRGVSKAVTDVLLFGPVAGPLVFGADEGNTTAQRLMMEGVDPATAAKVGVATGVIQGASVAIPGVGSTVAKTFGLAALSGPAAYVAQEKLSHDILKNADYGTIAEQHDPLDPLGLVLSTAIPFAVGGLHARTLKRRKLEDVVKHIESGGQRFGKDGQLLTSPKGAQGEMQVMPGTASDPGFGVTPAKDGSPEELARVGRDYLNAMHQRYGDTDKALAAYNAGPGAVDAAVKAKGDKWLEAMPDETKAYVSKANKLLGEHTVSKAADDPAVVDAARVKVADETLAKSLPDTPTAHADVFKASDELAAGRAPDVAPVPTTALPEFRAWFEGSRVVDEEGAPLVVYHGTAANFDAVSPAKLDAEGIHLSTDPQTASTYAVSRAMDEQGANVVPVYVRAEKIKEVPVVTTEAIQSARAEGFDAVRKGDHIVVMEPKQIKSAIGNSGKFDPNSPSLTDPLKPGEKSPRQQAAAARESTSQLPRSDSPTLEPDAGKAAKSEAEAGAVDQERLKAIVEERPDMLVKMEESGETMTVEQALLKAHEEYDEEVDFAQLLKVAAECALANGG
jgi:hypothetical protein